MNNTFLKRKILEARYYKIVQMEKKVKKELEELESKCNHDVIVKYPSRKDPEKILQLEFRPSTECLLCREHLSPRKYLPEDEIKKMNEATCIDFEKYPKILNKGRAAVDSWLEKRFFKLSKENPDKTPKEIAEIIIKELEERENK